MLDSACDIIRGGTMPPPTRSLPIPEDCCRCCCSCSCCCCDNTAPCRSELMLRLKGDSPAPGAPGLVPDPTPLPKLLEPITSSSARTYGPSPSGGYLVPSSEGERLDISKTRNMLLMLLKYGLSWFLLMVAACLLACLVSSSSSCLLSRLPRPIQPNEDRIVCWWAFAVSWFLLSWRCRRREKKRTNDGG